MKITQYEIDLMKEIEQAKDAETAKTFKRKLRRRHRQKAVRAVQEALGTSIPEIPIQLTYEIEF